jgi:predicted Ser/Thr protein kinase/VIT1/CCC1 family predicted Fe2+/Mn2+ transporter
MVSETIGKYKVEGELGRGGMGVVYCAKDTATGNTVALKVLFPEFALDPGYVKRFRREAEALAKLNHPNIVRIHGIGEERGVPYYAMDHVEGRSLAAMLAAGEWLDISRALDLAIEVAAALGHAHKAGIIHRDIKPGNILIDKSGKPKLTDFGIARLTYATRMTRTGDIVGTPEYMSPEQGKGATVDKASDVYSLGVVIYELLAHRVPFQGATVLEVIKKHQYEEPENIKSLNKAIPDNLARVVMKMLAKKPDERYKSAEQAATALSTIRPTVIRAAVAKEKRISGTAETRVLGTTPGGDQQADVRIESLAGKRCPQCNASLAIGDRICVSCGTDLTTGRSVTKVALKRARKSLLMKIGVIVGATVPLAGLVAVVTLLMGTYYIGVALLVSLVLTIITWIGGSIRREPVARRIYIGIFLGFLLTVLYGLLWDTAPEFRPLFFRGG